MNRQNLKSYAPLARRDFIQAIKDRAAFYGLTANKIEPVVGKGDVAVIAGREHLRAVANKRKQLEARIKKHGFEQTMEAMAYTWFNRLVAIRFMELHGYLDHGYRVLSHPEGKPTPEILEHAEHVEFPGLKRETVIDLKVAGNKEDELYRLLLSAQCNALQMAMPFLFERIDDETELLLPDNLLHSDSLIRKLVTEIDEEDWQQVEVIGWLYQFYISEKKDEVIGKVVASEDIPAATQLFTPNWIVKYLVQNTLGRQWLATYPQSVLRQQMEYYIEPAEQTPQVQEQLKAITPISLNPEELTLLDPACGSGHILVEAYDLFKAIYQERGYRAKDIPALILQKNLFGLEIDDRASQLAAFALMMKARADDRRLFESDAKPKVLAFEDSQGMTASDITHALNSPINNNDLPSEYLFEEIQEDKDGLFSKKALAVKGDVSESDIASLLELFQNAKTFGSLIQVPTSLAAKLPGIERRLDDVSKHGDLTHAPSRVIKPLLQQAGLLAHFYDAVVANPPYMGSRLMTPEIKRFARAYYPNSKADLFAICTERFLLFLDENSDGTLALMTPFTWMFIQSYEHLRSRFLAEGTLTSLIRPEYHSFFDSAFVPICAFIFRRIRIPQFKGSFIDLASFYGEDIQPIKAREAIHADMCPWRYFASAEDFRHIPGQPIAYWVSDKVKSLFSQFETLGQISQPRKGNSTSDNDRFLRQWHELSLDKIGIGLVGPDKRYRWIPYNKGGGFRRWFGLNCFVIDWLDEGAAIRDIPTAVIANESLFFKPGLTWSTITVSHFSVRLFDEGFIFDNGGCCVFSSPSIRLYLLGLLNSKVFEHVLERINPTLNYQSGDVAKFPTFVDDSIKADVEAIAQECVLISKQDWDSSETSWEFAGSPLLSLGSGHATVALCFEAMKAKCEWQIERLIELEEQNNRLLAASYGLTDEIQATVDIEQITLHRPDYGEDTKRLLSYAIGCIMGRYSLDNPGLIYAHGGNHDFNPSRYSTFRADEDGIIPLLETDWGIRDDAANRLVEFVGVAWPEENLEANLKFIADGLGPSSNVQPRETVRRYLATGFYKHHLSLYKRRPIYWLFSSGKERAFQCLVYLHRYHEGTLARMRTEYVIPLQGQIAARIEQLEGDKAKATSTSHRNKLQKEQTDLKKQQAELIIFEEKLKHAADQRISFDLDAGVKVNYGKFGDLVAESKAITGGKDDE